MFRFVALAPVAYSVLAFRGVRSYIPNTAISVSKVSFLNAFAASENSFPRFEYLFRNSELWHVNKEG